VIFVREFDKEGPRADGAPVMWTGREDGPALVVVDPTGAAKHDLPPTWDNLAEHFQVAWCRTPASERSLEDIEDVLETLTERHVPANLVASGTACTAAIAIAKQFADVVSAVLLVDPAGDEEIGALTDTDVEVMVVARSHAGPTDRVEAPMPLGHPEVVEGIVAALAGLG
jgi:pimeloyl-ACP methyl ester carboxylesterase